MITNSKHPSTHATGTPLHTAIIYEGYGAQTGDFKIVHQGSASRLSIVAIGDPAEVITAAAQLADEGAQLIELCGAISPTWRSKVNQSLAGRAKVSSVTFGFESLALGAAFSASFEQGKPPKEAFIILSPGSDPDKDRFQKAFPPQHTTFVLVPDEASGVKVASELAASGFGLIELYGGFSDAGAAQIIEAVEGRVPVGLGSFTVQETSALRTIQAP